MPIRCKNSTYSLTHYHKCNSNNNHSFLYNCDTALQFTPQSTTMTSAYTTSSCQATRTLRPPALTSALRVRTWTMNLMWKTGMVKNTPRITTPCWSKPGSRRYFPPSDDGSGTKRRGRTAWSRSGELSSWVGTCGIRVTGNRTRGNRPGGVTET